MMLLCCCNYRSYRSVRIFLIKFLSHNFQKDEMKLFASAAASQRVRKGRLSILYIHYLRTFKTFLLSLFFAGTVDDPGVLSPLDLLKKEFLGKPFPAPASSTIFSSMVSPSIVFSSSEEAFTLPAERDNITVQTSPHAVKTGISGSRWRNNRICRSQNGDDFKQTKNQRNW